MNDFYLLVSAFGDPFSNNNSRINNVYDYCPRNKLIITTDFDHGKKNKRNKDSNNCSRNILQLTVPQYKKNVSFRRFYSHLIFAFKLKKRLKKFTQKPTLIYCAMPTSFAAFFCGCYCKRNNIRFVIDIIDIWPESLLVLLPFKKFFKLIFRPWYYISRKAYKMADIIFAESKSYLEIAKKYNNTEKAYAFYLGSDTEQASNYMNSSNVSLNKPDDEVWICYGGSLGSSYDFDVIFDALNHLKCNVDVKFRFLFIGDGVRRKEIEQKIKNMNIPAEVTGSLEYNDFLKYLSFCDIGINPFLKDTKVAFSYKFNDYVVTNLCILNNLKGETSELVDKYKIGRNFDYSNSKLSEILEKTVLDKDFINSSKINCKHIANTVLNKKNIYKSMICKMLEK